MSLRDQSDIDAACELCGCTEDDACPGGCAWVPNVAGRDLCSACVEQMPELERQKLLDGEL